MRVLTTNTATGKYIPDEVLADREKRGALAPRSITASFFGDPLPGYSAAERAPSIAPTITADPLDVLWFNRKRRLKTSARYG